MGCLSGAERRRVLPRIQAGYIDARLRLSWTTERRNVQRENTGSYRYGLRGAEGSSKT
jgi:hypothetical protein